ncbi:hypothetical protein EDD75_1207 [Thermodesulfitimonas autotrophica]|uniref:Uncharacterized protein n=1 Tax=Thermodesulfitimonas autotrophica TaxID=1894989 RepID=A0A3N5BMI0_9THEO|nr:hypothetical protein EDD75_1207 [Thermodesulfitimonas autotrophica]
MSTFIFHRVGGVASGVRDKRQLGDIFRQLWVHVGLEDQEESG